MNTTVYLPLRLRNRILTFQKSFHTSPKHPPSHHTLLLKGNHYPDFNSCVLILYEWNHRISFLCLWFPSLNIIVVQFVNEFVCVIVEYSFSWLCSIPLCDCSTVCPHPLAGGHWRVSSLGLTEWAAVNILSWCPCVSVHRRLHFSCIYTNEWKPMFTFNGFYQESFQIMNIFLNFIMV